MKNAVLFAMVALLTSLTLNACSLFDVCDGEYVIAADKVDRSEGLIEFSEGLPQESDGFLTGTFKAVSDTNTSVPGSVNVWFLMPSGEWTEQQWPISKLEGQPEQGVFEFGDEVIYLMTIAELVHVGPNGDSPLLGSSAFTFCK